MHRAETGAAPDASTPTRWRGVFILVGVWLLTVAPIAAEEFADRPAASEISVLTLVPQMSDLGRLARQPKPSFTMREESSTDRRARTPKDPHTWFANDDFVTDRAANLVRVDTEADGSKRYVLLDAKGPGVVVRIWTATPAGTLRLYVDGAARPVLAAPMAALLSGEEAPFVPPFGQVTARGYSLYFPFPFKKRCLITVDSIVSQDPFSGAPVDRLYYQVWLRHYRPEVARQVRSYSAAELERAGGVVARVARELRDPPPPETPGQTTIPIDTTAIEKGRPAVTTLLAPTGGAEISQLRLVTAERDPETLRSTTLSLAFDGEETVRVPLVDFFGTGSGFNQQSSLPLSVTIADGSLVSRFRMPFRQRAVITISRDVPGVVEVGGEVTVEPTPFRADSLLLHCGRRPMESIPTRPVRDWHLATLTGSGQLVGTVLDAENPPGVAWWGEGDEKIYVDGERFPGIFGTGTEDYFGYAWSSMELFSHPYHAQTRATGPGFSGQFSMSRFHVIDPIPFRQSLRFDLEAWHQTDTTMKLGATLYWYARPGATDDFPTSH